MGFQPTLIRAPESVGRPPPAAIPSPKRERGSALLRTAKRERAGATSPGGRPGIALFPVPCSLFFVVPALVASSEFPSRLPVCAEFGVGVTGRGRKCHVGSAK